MQIKYVLQTVCIQVLKSQSTAENAQIVPRVTVLKPGELCLGDIYHIYGPISIISVTTEQRPLTAGTLSKVLI